MIAKNIIVNGISYPGEYNIRPDRNYALRILNARGEIDPVVMEYIDPSKYDRVTTGAEGEE